MDSLTSKEKVERLRHVFEDARRMVRSWTLPHTEALFNIIADMQQEIEGLQMGQPPVVVVSTADEPPASLPKEPRCVNGEWIYNTQSYGYNEESAVECWSAYSSDLRKLVAAPPPTTLHRDQIKAICHALNGNCVMVDDPERPPCTSGNCAAMKAAARAEVPPPAPRFSPTECKHEAVHFKCTDCGLDLRDGRLSVPPAAGYTLFSDAWQPIDTAPKDGRRFLAIGMGPIFFAHWGEGANTWFDDAGAERSPRYWMRAPEGPTLTKEAPRPLGGRTWTQEEIDADQFREEQRAQEKGDPHAKYVCVQPEFEVKVADEKPAALTAPDAGIDICMAQHGPHCACPECRPVETSGARQPWTCKCGQVNSDWAQECGRCERRPEPQAQFFLDNDGAIDYGTPPVVTCEGCGNEIDPETCGCGDPIKGHSISSGHSAVPMGCDCHRGSHAD